MKSVFLIALSAAFFFGELRAVVAANNSWDTFSDTWVATDGLGRSLPTQAEVGTPRKNKFVGIFYFLWLGRHSDAGPYDITKILAADPDAMNKPDSPLWGGRFTRRITGANLFLTTTFLMTKACSPSTRRCCPTRAWTPLSSM